MAADGFVTAMIRCVHQELDLRRMSCSRDCSLPLRRSPARNLLRVNREMRWRSRLKVLWTAGCMLRHLRASRDIFELEVMPELKCIRLTKTDFDRIMLIAAFNSAFARPGETPRDEPHNAAAPSAWSV
jgi:hypothetical protein